MKTKMFFLAAVASIFFSACEPCGKNGCENGGTCVDGTCECPVGYHGEHCELQSEPINAMITHIDVVNFFEAQWDASSDADIFLTGAYGSACGEEWGTSIIDNADAFSPHWWQVDWLITEPQTALSVCLYDYDSDTQVELIQDFHINLTDYDEGWPSSFDVIVNTVHIRFYVDWNV